MNESLYPTWYAKPGQIVPWSLWYRIKSDVVQCRSTTSDWGPTGRYQTLDDLIKSTLHRVSAYPSTQIIDPDLYIDFGL